MHCARWDSPTFRGPPVREYAHRFESHAQGPRTRAPRALVPLLVSTKLQKKKPPFGGFLFYNLAETVGFEPTIRV